MSERGGGKCPTFTRDRVPRCTRNGAPWSHQPLPSTLSPSAAAAAGRRLPSAIIRRRRRFCAGRWLASVHRGPTAPHISVQSTSSFYAAEWTRESVGCCSGVLLHRTCGYMHNYTDGCVDASLPHGRVNSGDGDGFGQPSG